MEHHHDSSFKQFARKNFFKEKRENAYNVRLYGRERLVKNIRHIKKRKK